jgi:hypothetical protein
MNENGRGSTLFPRAGALRGEPGDGPRQLDFFIDGRDALLVHEVVTALIARDADRAGDALGRLRREQPLHVDLAALTLLAGALAGRAPASATHASVTERVDAIERALAPAARRFLGRDADVFLRPHWQALAQLARDLPFDPAHPRAHHGWLAQQHGDWATARAAIEAEPAWASTPVLRHWLGTVEYHRGETEAAVRLWLPVCWMDPASFARQAPALPSPTLRDDWDVFQRGAPFTESFTDTADAVVWFPAWLLLRHRGLARLFLADEVPDGNGAARVFGHLLGLLPLEQQGLSDELVRQRRRLRAIAPGFFRYYMEVVERQRRPPKS